QPRPSVLAVHRVRARPDRPGGGQRVLQRGYRPARTRRRDRHDPLHPRSRPGVGMTATAETTTSADVNFYFDPVCPFAWMTSKWLRMVQAQRDYAVDWRFISLRMINAAVDYGSHFPPGYEAGHTAGLRLLRVA